MCDSQRALANYGQERKIRCEHEWRDIHGSEATGRTLGLHHPITVKKLLLSHHSQIQSVSMGKVQRIPVEKKTLFLPLPFMEQRRYQNE
jgi:hypothetical protein